MGTVTHIITMCGRGRNASDMLIRSQMPLTYLVEKA